MTAPPVTPVAKRAAVSCFVPPPPPLRAVHGDAKPWPAVDVNVATIGSHGVADKLLWFTNRQTIPASSVAGKTCT